MLFQGRSQQPAYFKLGENELKGIQVYDIIQDHRLDYWFATNEGLFRYNYSSFEKVDCDQARSNSVFNFVKDRNGVIYCHNLYNQVFRIADGEMSVFYEIKEDELRSDVSLAIGDDGNLIVNSKQILILNQEGKVIHRKVLPQFYIGPPFTSINGEVHFHLASSDSILTYSKGHFSFNTLNKRGNVLRFINSEKYIYGVDLSTKEIFAVDEDFTKITPLKGNPLLDRSQSIRLYETKKGIWSAGTLPGVQFFGNDLTNTEALLYYDTYFISDVYEDLEGNILLATFDKGILVIPDLKVNDVIGQFNADPVTSIWIDQDQQLIAGTSEGRLIQLKNRDFSPLNKEGKRPIEVICGNEKVILFDDGHIRGFLRKEDRVVDLLEASLKSAVYIGNDQFYLGTNLGVYKLTVKGKELYVEPISQLRVRIHRMTYDKKNQILYVSTARGSFEMDNKGVLKEVKFKSELIYPNNMLVHSDQLWLLHRTKGILIYQGGKFHKKITPMVNGKPITLKKICFYKSTLIGSTLDGLYQMDLNGNMLRSLHTYAGISNYRVIDFAIQDENLWVSHSGGLQKIQLDKRHQMPSGIDIRFEEIRVQGKVIPIQSTSLFSTDDRNIQFVFSSPTLKNRNGIRFHFRLKGAENNWTINEFNENQVSFRALSPGTYEFQVKAEIQGKFSEVLHFRFVINAPFYTRWWFIVLMGLAFMGMVLLIYRQQTKIRDRRSRLINELHASKLTAIQSQMNPHFIFNSLNSIQDLILKGDVEHSYSYITTFSDLVRRTLNYSEKDFIDFEQEIRLLELYLSLEQLRFKKDFTYSIDADGIDDILLPPLLVQPFVENALVHGLLHKKGAKHLTIRFTYDEHLICVIEDNGIGREAARQIRQRQRADHESFSSEAIRKRFEILSEVFHGEFGYTYEDLYEHGDPQGTRVILHIPIQQKF